MNRGPTPPDMPLRRKAGKAVKPEKACPTLSAKSKTKDWINEHRFSNKESDADRDMAQDVVEGLEEICERTEGCTFQEHNLKCKAKKHPNLAEQVEQLRKAATKKKRAPSKKKAAPAKKRAPSKAKRTPSKAKRAPSKPKRARSASPKPSGKAATLPDLRKKGIGRLTKDELIEFVKRTRTAYARTVDKKLSDLAPLSLPTLRAMSKAELVTLAKKWNKKL